MIGKKNLKGLVIGLSFLAFLLSQLILAIAQDTLPKALLPNLENYGFKLTKVVEMIQSDWMKSVASITEQFNIPGMSPEIAGQLTEQFNFPLLSAAGNYTKNDNERIAIDVYKFENEKNSRKWFDSQVSKKKELEDLFKAKATTAKLEKTQINGKEAYCFTFGSSDLKAQAKPGYETSLFWQNEEYFFDIKFYSMNPWPQTEAVKVANEIKP